MLGGLEVEEMVDGRKEEGGERGRGLNREDGWGSDLSGGGRGAARGGAETGYEAGAGTFAPSSATHFHVSRPRAFFCATRDCQTERPPRRAAPT
jgi:hypothetical protein